MTASLEQVIAQARNDGVKHPDNLPFLLTPDKPSKTSILLVHGFGATPQEMRGLANHLKKNGLSVLAIRLPGHGTTPEDLANQRIENWLAATRQGYDILRQNSTKVSAVGLSTGGLLLLLLAEQLNLDRLVLLSPYLRLKHPLAPYVRLLSWIIPFQEREIAAAEQPFYYQRRPLKGIAELNRLQQQVKRTLPNITTPTLVLASKGDQTIYPGTAKRVFQLLGSRNKDFFSYGEEVPHALTSAENPQQHDVFSRVTDWFTA